MVAFSLSCSSTSKLWGIHMKSVRRWSPHLGHAKKEVFENMWFTMIRRNILQFITNFPRETVCNNNVPASGEHRNCNSMLCRLCALHQTPDEENSLVVLKLPLLFIL